MRSFLRFVAIFIGPALAVVALAALGPELRYALASHTTGWMLAFACVLVAFGGVWLAAWGIAGRNPLGARRPEDRDRRPRRYAGAHAALVWVVLASAYLLALKPPPFATAGERATVALLAIDIVLALAAFGTLDRPHPVGRWLVVAGGAWGLASVANGVRLLRGVHYAEPGPAMVWSLLLAASVLLMWIAAAVIVLTAWRWSPPE